MFKRALLVAAREFSVTVRRKAYILTIVGMPILFGGMIFVSGYFAARSAVKSAASAVAVVDSSGVLDWAILRQLSDAHYGGSDIFSGEIQGLIDERVAGIPPRTLNLATEQLTGFVGAAIFIMENADSAKAAAQRGDLDGALVIAGDYLQTGRVWGFGRAESLFSEGESSNAERALRRTLTLSLLQGSGLDVERQQRVLNPMDLREFELRTGGETAGEFEEKGAGSAIRSFALPYAFSILLLMSIMMTGGFLLQGVAEEKENRVIELLLSSVTPEELMMGKVIGLGSAGLLQMAVWLGMALAALIFASSRWIPDFDVPVFLFLQALVYFLLGYLMIASLMAGAGSLGSTQKESQQLSTWFTLPVVAPMIMMMAIMSEPNGTLARVLSYIPITSPVTMMMRLPSEQVPWWEFPATVVLLVLAVWFSLWLGARLFRLGSLMYGKRPTVPEIFKWLKAA